MFDYKFLGTFGGSIGILLSFASAILTSCGLCLQRVVYKKVIARRKLPSLYTHRAYVFGVVFVVIGTLLKIINYGLLPQSTLAPLSALNVLFTQYFETVFMNETITPMLVVCNIIVWLGVCISVLSASLNDPDYSLTELVDLFFTENVILYTCLVASAILSTKIVFNFSWMSSRQTVALLYLSIVSGIYAGWSCTLGKAVVEIFIHAQIHGVSELLDVTAWFFLLCIPLFSWPKTMMVQEGLLQFHHLLFLPLYQAFAIAFNGAFGILYFHEMSPQRLQSESGNVRWYLIGMITTCIGVAMSACKFDRDVHTVVTGSDDEKRSLTIGTRILRRGPGNSSLNGPTFNGPTIDEIETDDDYLEEDYTGGDIDYMDDCDGLEYSLDREEPVAELMDMSVMPLLSQTQTQHIQDYFSGVYGRGVTGGGGGGGPGNRRLSTLSSGPGRGPGSVFGPHSGRGYADRFSSSPAYPKSYLGNWASAGSVVSVSGALAGMSSKALFTGTMGPLANNLNRSETNES